MSIVKPFKGLRPKPEFAGEVASPPYDVLNAKEARAMAANNPKSFLRVNKAELEFDDNVDQYSRQVYQRGKDNLQKLIDDKIMIRDEKPCFYLYRLTMDGRAQHGLVALASVEEYDKGLIKKHEHTRPEKVNDRANHITFLEAQVGPVFLTFRSNQNIKELFAKITSDKPQVDFTADDGIKHEFWVIDNNETIALVSERFNQLPYLYVADGHHRSQSASEICHRNKESNPNHTGEEPYNFFLTVSFPDDELKILPYNRVVKDNTISMDEVFKQAGDKFEIKIHEGELAPATPHHFGVYTEGKWYELIAKDGSFDPKDPVNSIDAAILGNNLIAPILGIENPKTDKRIDFVGGIRGTKELMKLVDSGEYQLAFSLYPTSIEQLLNVADAGEVMPPKSTWFEPKLRSGMVVNLLTN